MVDAKSIDTQMPTNGNLDRDGNDKDVDVQRYKGMIGSLLYLIASRYEIMFSVCMCARYLSTPKESHFKAVKHILRYLHGNFKYGLWFSKGRDCSLVGYSDSDFSDCKLDRKSTSGTRHILFNSLVSWHSKKKVYVPLSTVEAEYIVSGSCCAQILWLKQQLLEFHIKLQCILIMCGQSNQKSSATFSY
ncbi:secreted RxLR effector protein 161-like [Lathyrus oleraceus]|uniref:secreted RxLR effector protein 161-like n=1 Tax=Pisum sativum TaxID=3888 RepID=UPI0021D1EF44|nr:secreted RxLR effector protein 161-like [Pisum sativum]